MFTSFSLYALWGNSDGGTSIDSTLGGISVLLVVMMMEDKVVCDGVHGKWGRFLYGRPSWFDRS
jgi:hypothetical protein